MTWAGVKNWVSAHNTGFILKDVEDLVRKRFDDISVEWRKFCKHVIKIEHHMIEKGGFLDVAIEFIVNAGTAEESNESDSTDSELSAIEELESD